MARVLYIIFVSVLLCISAFAQNLTQQVTAIQYYFDTPDPGVGVAGNGAVVSVNNTADYIATVSIAIPALSNGFHNLYIRARDDFGSWSTSERRLFFVQPPVNTQTLTAMEYYFDADPGAGNGTSISVTPSADINNTFPINTSCLTIGTHFCYVRAKDQFARWSIIERDTFTVGQTVLSINPPGPIQLCINDSVKLYTNFVSGFNYQWLLNGNAITGAIDTAFTTHNAGNYSVVRSCGSNFDTSALDEITLYPLQTFYADADNDGFGNPLADTVTCFAPPGYVTNNSDCNDSNHNVHPGATEICNGIDDDCDGLIDDADPSVAGQSFWFQDADGDGYGNAAVSVISCNQPVGYVLNHTDCNDANSAIHPGAVDICNGIDDNCNGIVDDTCSNIYDGGPGDGFTSLTVTNISIGPSIYLGGNNDGFSSYFASNQSIGASIYLGGNNDGFSSYFASNQSIGASIYLGGNNDGFSSYFASNQSVGASIYLGGNNDGFSSYFASNQSIGASIYLGGNNDGFSSYFASNQHIGNSIYLGGNDDGFAMALSPGVALKQVITLQSDNTNQTISIFPNPTHDRLNVVINNFSNEIRWMLKIFDLNGKKIHEQKMDSSEENIDFSNLPSETYILTVVNEKGFKENIKIIVSK